MAIDKTRFLSRLHGRGGGKADFLLENLFEMLLFIFTVLIEKQTEVADIHDNRFIVERLGDRSINNDDPLFFSNTVVEIFMRPDSFVRLNTRVKQEDGDIRIHTTSANVNDTFIIRRLRGVYVKISFVLCIRDNVARYIYSGQLNWRSLKSNDAFAV